MNPQRQSEIDRIIAQDWPGDQVIGEHSGSMPEVGEELRKLTDVDSDPPGPHPAPIIPKLRDHALPLRVGLALFGVIVAASVTMAAPPRPHIVFVLADDLGWGDVGYHGSHIQTPTIDRLAAAGIQLTQFYVQPKCSPTRAALLTGRYPFRYGLVNVVNPGQPGLLTDERLLPQPLSEAGYFTAIVGKWHLGDASGERPRDRGFDYQYGPYAGKGDHYNRAPSGPSAWFRNGVVVSETGYDTDLIAKACVSLISNHDPDQPLFLFVPMTAVHQPSQAPAAVLERYVGIGKKRRALAAMVTCMDSAIERIVTALESRGMWDNTLLVFCSDNGGVKSQGASNLPWRGAKGDYLEGGIRVPAFVVWPRVLVPGATDELMHIVDWYPTLLRLAGAPTDQPLRVDGVDLWPTLHAGIPTLRFEIPFAVGPSARRGDLSVVKRRGTEGASRVIRYEDWKLVVGPGGKRGSVALYNLCEDPSEQTEYSKQYPDIVRKLERRLAMFAEESLLPVHAWGTPRRHRSRRD